MKSMVVEEAYAPGRDAYPSLFAMFDIRFLCTWDGDVEVLVSGRRAKCCAPSWLGGRTQLDVSDLTSGIYFLTLRSTALATTRRFVVAEGSDFQATNFGKKRKPRPVRLGFLIFKRRLDFPSELQLSFSVHFYKRLVVEHSSAKRLFPTELGIKGIP